MFATDPRPRHPEARVINVLPSPAHVTSHGGGVPHHRGFGHAVVIGGSMAGLVAARVLTDHFDRVTLVERDRLPDRPAFRAGVPQSRHLHGLLPGGLAVLEQLFPGYQSELEAAGAPRFAMPRDALWLSAAGWFERFPGVEGVTASRELIEHTVRQRVTASDRMQVRDGSAVSGVVATPDGSAVTGVRLRRRDGRDGSSDSAEETVAADLVVDASGRSSKTPEWLAALGYPTPALTRINASLGYASRAYAIPHGFRADWRLLLLQSQPPGIPRTGYLFPVEGDRWMVSLMGAGGDYPPTDEAGFMAWARGLRSPILHEVMRDAEPLSPIYGHRGTDNRQWHFERMPRWPDGLVALGDAVCAFNPVYGQGMTVAARAAMVLDRCLHEQAGRQPGGGLAGLSRRVQRLVAKANAPAWMMATGEDLRYPTTEGARPDLQTRVMHRYLDRVLAAATHHPVVNQRFFQVLSMLAPPSTLFHPQVLLPALRRRREPAPAVAPPSPLPAPVAA
jgi:flavin-dependent dehydrogenase